RNARSSSFTTILNLNSTTQSPIRFLFFKQLRLASKSRSAGYGPRRDHGPTLEPEAPHRPRPAASVRPEGTHAGAGPPAQGQRRYPRRRRAPRRRLSGRHLGRSLECQQDWLGSSRLPQFLARLRGECSVETNIGNDVGFEPTTLRVKSDALP